MAKNNIVIFIATIILLRVNCVISCCEWKTCEVRLRTDAGWACGRVRDAENGTKYASFRGVPYAKPPVGSLRFKELELPDHWDYLKDATEDGPACPQKDFFFGRIPLQPRGQSEDCMYLNLHVPCKADYTHNTDVRQIWDDAKAKGKRGLPILVFIHGGGFESGSGLTDLYGPEYLIPKGVIVLTFNYRINVFGFLSLNSKEIPGNQGLRDMVTLLRWVQRNALNFGGDPGDVTIMGQSTGSTAAHLLSLSKVTTGLFKRVIMTSGTAITSFYSASPKYSKYLADIFLDNLGINSTDPEYIHEQLIRMPLENLMYANTVVQFIAGVTGFTVVVEPKYPGITRVVDDEPIALIAKGRGKNYPILISFTSEEFVAFKGAVVFLDLPRRVKENPVVLLSPRLVFNLPPEAALAAANEVSQRYLNGTPTTDALANYFSDSFIKYPSFKLVEWRAAIGGAPVYLSQYSYKSEYSVVKKALWITYDGAAHLDDTVLIFRPNSMLDDNNSVPTRNRDDRMKDWLTKFVTNFMRCSNPTCAAKWSMWPPISKGKILYQSVDQPMVYQVMEPTTEQLDMIRFFDNIDEEIRNVSEALKSG